MRYLFHGTTVNAMEEIIKGNYNPDYTIWNCSDDCYMYVYEQKKLCEAECWDDFDLLSGGCIERANESAQIANAILDKPFNATVVIQFKIPDNLFDELVKEETLKDDDSCENTYGAMQIRSRTINQLIKEKKIGITVYYLPFYVKLSLFYLVGLFDNQYFQETLEKLPNGAYKALEMLTKVDTTIIWEDIIYVEPESEHTIYEPKFDDNRKGVN